ncbi:FAD-dependent oxidoreductase [Pseudoxanthomonas sp. NC8]|nr:FAD-dependent oxidoreductase [Pseudoxanthomonas sp. NC8]
MDRRDFLKAAGINAGALAVGMGLGAAPVAANGQRAARANPAGGASDIAVVGAGAFGGWTALYLREQGHAVALVDQYGAGNALASSGGESRQIRAGYGERELYTRWVLQAFERWEARQAEWGRKLFYRTGQLSLADAWSTSLASTRGSFDRLQVPYEVLDLDEVRRRFPQIATHDAAFGFYTPTTGVLKAREGCVAVADAFARQGGTVLDARVEPGRRRGRTLLELKRADGGTVQASQFVFALGPWLPKVFPALLGRKIQSPRRAVFFVATPPGDNSYSYPNFPTWSAGGAYGFPSVEGRGFKLAPRIDEVLVDPDTQDRHVKPHELAAAREFVARWFPGLRDQPLVDARICQYENSVDSNLIVDRHPEFDNVWVVGVAPATATSTGSCLASTWPTG